MLGLDVGAAQGAEDTVSTRRSLPAVTISATCCPADPIPPSPSLHLCR